MIYMRGVKSHEILAVLDFIYCGEANVFEVNLEAFLALAEDLKLKGLIENEPRENVSDSVKSNVLKLINLNFTSRICLTCLNS